MRMPGWLAALVLAFVHLVLGTTVNCLLAWLHASPVPRRARVHRQHARFGCGPTSSPAALIWRSCPGCAARSVAVVVGPQRIFLRPLASNSPPSAGHGSRDIFLGPQARDRRKLAASRLALQCPGAQLRRAKTSARHPATRASCYQSGPTGKQESNKLCQ